MVLRFLCLSSLSLLLDFSLLSGDCSLFFFVVSLSTFVVSLALYLRFLAIVGLTYAYEKTHNVSQHFRLSNITFTNTLVTGYAITQLLQKNQAKLRNILVKLTKNDTYNGTDQSTIWFKGCNLVIGGLMTVDSPYRGLILTSSRYSTSISELPNSRIFLHDNATLTVLKGGTMNVVTGTLIAGRKISSFPFRAPPYRRRIPSFLSLSIYL
jgi:hypothetical protein